MEQIEGFNKTIVLYIIPLDTFMLTQIVYRPDSQSWSVGQLYQHIINDTYWYINQIKIALQNNQNAEMPIAESAHNPFNERRFTSDKIAGHPSFIEVMKILQPYR